MSDKPRCAVADCNKKAKRWGLCKRHTCAFSGCHSLVMPGAVTCPGHTASVGVGNLVGNLLGFDLPDNVLDAGAAAVNSFAASRAAQGPGAPPPGPQQALSGVARLQNQGFVFAGAKPTEAEVNDFRRRMVKAFHSDTDGSEVYTGLLGNINRAADDALKEIGARPG
jgi:hypothetical protein